MQFESGNYYHIYNRGINRCTIFYRRSNYYHFIDKIKRYISPHCSIVAWCLMPNHFHLLVKIREDSIIEAYYKLKKGKDFNPIAHSISDFIMEQFSNWLNGYAKAYNKMYDRQGAVFLDYLIINRYQYY